MTATPEDLRDRIAALAGPYNLPDGRVPLVDGAPDWPWSDAVAHQRLRRVARQLGIALPGDESLLGNGSNDTWLVGDRVVRVCWRGDVSRLVREAELAASLPRSACYPGLLAYGSDEGLSWILAPRVRGETLAAAWPVTPERELRPYVDQLAGILRDLHGWDPRPELAARLTVDESRHPSAVDIAGRTLTPLTAAALRSLLEYARGMPYVEPDLLDPLAERVETLLDRTGSLDGPRTFLHGDFAPWNVIVRSGRVVAVLDYEWARIGPPYVDLLTPGIWQELQDPAARPDRFRCWLREGYPELFEVSDLPARLQLYRAGFVLRGLVHWPPDGPEQDLPPTHPVRMARDLLSGPPGAA